MASPPCDQRRSTAFKPSYNIARTTETRTTGSGTAHRVHGRTWGGSRGGAAWKGYAPGALVPVTTPGLMVLINQAG